MVQRLSLQVPSSGLFPEQFVSAMYYNHSRIVKQIPQDEGFAFCKRGGPIFISGRNSIFFGNMKMQVIGKQIYNEKGTDGFSWMASLVTDMSR